jgi:hypothetical protein
MPASNNPRHEIKVIMLSALVCVIEADTIVTERLQETAWTYSYPALLYVKGLTLRAVNEAQTKAMRLCWLGIPQRAMG